MSLSELLRAARDRRLTEIESWRDEGSDSYRLFHGAVEGRPGLAIDRYGVLTLVQQASSSPMGPQEQEGLLDYLLELGGAWLICQREGGRLKLIRESAPGLWQSTFWARELGLEFAVNLSRAHRDPQLFLDFRAAKRELIAHLEQAERGCSVLNLFAYTCSISCHAARTKSHRVWSVDFSSGNLAWGEKNFRRNRLPAEAHFLSEDCIGVLWGLTNRGRRKKLTRPLEEGRFDVVIADPPAFSKGKFATVDVIHDPETVYGPAWEVVAPGGLLVAANNSARVSRLEFEQRLSRLFAKRAASGECASITWVSPDPDFPSSDGEPPLKVAFCRKV